MYPKAPRTAHVGALNSTPTLLSIKEVLKAEFGSQHIPAPMPDRPGSICDQLVLNTQYEVTFVQTFQSPP